MTEKMIELLQGIISVLDAFLDKVGDTIIYGDGIGGGTIGYLNVVSSVIFICLGVAFVWNVMEAVSERAAGIGDPTRSIPLKQLKKCIFIFIIAFLMVGSSAVFYKSPKTGSYLGISYRGMSSGLSADVMNRAMATLGAVDIVENWISCLRQFDADRQEKILQAMAAKDPKLAESYRVRHEFQKDPYGAPLSLKEKVKTIWSTAVSITNGQASLLFVQFLTSLAIYGLAFVIVAICTFFFVFQAGRTLVMLAFYLKLSALLTTILVPASIGMLYFERLRHFGVTILKQIVVITIVGGVLGRAVQVVFSNAMIKQAIALAMKSDLAPYGAKISESEMMHFMTVTDGKASTAMFGATVLNQHFAASMTPEQVMGSIFGVVKILFLLGAMLMIISKMLDIVSGVMAGHWDPFAEGSRSAG